MPRDTWWNLPSDKRERITRVAQTEFGRRGFSAGSLNVIAREAGIAKGSLFQYFHDKLDLFATICDASSSDIEEAVLRGVDRDGSQPYFKSLRRIVRNWLVYFRTHPVEQGIAFAAAHEIDPEAGAAVRSVTNAHFVGALGPMVKRAKDRGEFRDGIDTDQLLAMTILLLRHLNTAPFRAHIDPVLGLAERSPEDVEGVAMDLVDALERAFGTSARGGARRLRRPRRTP